MSLEAWRKGTYPIRLAEYARSVNDTLEYYGGMNQGKGGIKMDEINNKNIPNQNTSGAFDEEDIKQNKTMAGLAYILFFLPLIVCKDSKFGRYHANQGLILLILSVIGYIALSIVTTILATITWRLFGLISLLYSVFGLFILVLAVYGLVNGLNGKVKELPVIGKYRIIK
jgi:uncharacterized membrane protein